MNIFFNLTSNQLFGNVSGAEETYPLDNFQNAIFQQIMTAMLKRDSHYDNSEYYAMSEEDVDDVEHEVVDEVVVDEEHFDIGGHGNNDDWRKFILITGRPGSGKSQIMNRTIQKCIEEGRNILATAPTGILASRYKKSFHPHIHTDTVHSAFTYPVSNERANVNWRINVLNIMASSNSINTR